MADWWKGTGWERQVDQGEIGRETAEALYDAGFESPADLRGIEWSISRTEEGTWAIEADGHAITVPMDDEDNDIVWDFYRWYEAEFEEPPEKDITSPGGKE